MEDILARATEAMGAKANEEREYRKNVITLLTHIAVSLDNIEKKIGK